MRDSSDPLIEAVVSPIKEPELRLAAVNLFSSMARDEVNGSDSEEVVIGRLGRDDGDRKSWRICLYAMGILAVIFSAVYHFRDAVTYKKVWSVSIFGWKELSESSGGNFDGSTWTEDDRLLLFGDAGRPEGQKRRTLWEKYPDDPSFYADYVADHLELLGKLPDGFRETAARIDPDNSFFIYLEAGTMLNGVVKSRSLNKAERKQGKNRWTISDEKKLNEALELVATAEGKARHLVYGDQLLLRRSSLLNYETRIDCIYSWGISFASLPLIHQSRIASGFGAKARQLADDGNVEEFVKLSEQAESFLRMIVKDDHLTAIHGVVTQSTIAKIAEDFGTGADQLGLEDLSARMKKLRVGIEGMQHARSLRKFELSDLEHRGDAWFSMATPFLLSISKDPLPITKEDLLPGSRADHALVSRGLVLTSGLITGVIAVVMGGRRFLISRLAMLTGDRVAGLMSWKDYGWAVLLGVMGPAIYLFLILYLTPFSGRDWKLDRTLPFLPTAQFIAWWMMTLGCSILVTRWRLRKRTGLLGVAGKSRAEFFGWVGMAAVAVSIPLIGAYVRIAPPIEPDVWWLAAFLAPGVLWLVWVAVKSPFGDAEKRITSAAVARVLVPVFAVSVILMMIFAVAFKVEDQYWFGQYEFARPVREGASYSFFDTSIQRSLENELRELLKASGVK